MKVTGIIAEYNPFHKGHQYQIETLRRRYEPDYVIVAMSGDFLQRGTPALMDKYARAQMVLSQGADLVFELPALFSTASAENFARGGILLFQTTGITDSLCFGAESDDLPRLSKLAGLMLEEPEWYRSALLSYLKEGLSFPAARAKALPEYADLLETPNNILAIEYLKSIKSLASDIAPILLRREGSGYHDADVQAPFASASAIRYALMPSDSQSTAFPRTGSHATAAPTGSRNTASPDKLPENLKAALPIDSFQIMTDYQKNSAFLWENDFSLLLHHALLKETPESLLQYEDMTESLANRLYQQRNSFLSWSSFCEACDTRDITYARISRILTHLLLDIKKEASAPYTEGSAHTLPYLRILGFRQSAAPLLTELKRAAKAPLITSPAAAEKLLPEQGLAMLHTDIYASDIYRSVLTGKTGNIYPGEYRRKLLIVE